MVLAISADLSAPPSSPSVYRDVTLFAKVFRNYDVLAYSEKDMIDGYVRWFRRYGLFDFVDDILTREQIKEVKIEIQSGKLTAYTLWPILSYL